MFTIIRWVIAQKSRLPLPFVRIGIGIYNRFKKKKKKVAHQTASLPRVSKVPCMGYNMLRDMFVNGMQLKGLKSLKCSNSLQVLQVT